MAYQFFAKNQQSRSAAAININASDSSQLTHQLQKPPTRPPRVIVPQASVRRTPNWKKHDGFQSEPYPEPTLPGRPTPHPNVTIEPVNTAHIASLTRITGLLLPIRYPSSFYTAIITDPVIASLSRVAIYHDHPGATATSSSISVIPDKVIGAIRCRLERQSQCLDSTIGAVEESTNNLYIQTLHLLSPYRGNGIAASLLNSLLFASPDSCVSDLVKHYNIRTVTAHVQEDNEEALAWYRARGFEVEEGVIEGYYRRLKPSGARLVKRAIEWKDEEEGEQDVPHDRDEQYSDQLTETALLDKDYYEEDDDEWEKV